MYTHFKQQGESLAALLTHSIRTHCWLHINWFYVLWPDCITLRWISYLFLRDDSVYFYKRKIYVILKVPEVKNMITKYAIQFNILLFNGKKIYLFYVHNLTLILFEILYIIKLNSIPNFPTWYLILLV